jgi:hypothetical protein
MSARETAVNALKDYATDTNSEIRIKTIEDGSKDTVQFSESESDYLPFFTLTETDITVESEFGTQTIGFDTMTDVHGNVYELAVEADK